MTTRKVFTVLGAVAVSAFVLAACRAEEQGRITEFKAGVYLGKKDTQLGSDVRRQLLLRAVNQGNTVYRSVGGSIISESTVDLDELKNRARIQRRIQ